MSLNDSASPQRFFQVEHFRIRIDGRSLKEVTSRKSNFITADLPLGHENRAPSHVEDYWTGLLENSCESKNWKKTTSRTHLFEILL